MSDSSLATQIADPETYSFKFTGTGKEYFKIWIVNLLLTILTFGIYSAWAKVRSRKYLYQHTVLENQHFDYTANPIHILEGRLILVVLFACCFVLGRWFPMISGLIGLILISSAPAILILSRRFNLRHITYRNINFNYIGKISSAYVLLFKYIFFNVFSLGLAYPYTQKMLHDFLLNSSLYGTTYFKYEAKASDYYKLYRKTSLLLFFAVCVFAALVWKVKLVASISSEVNVVLLLSIISYMFLIMGLYAGLYKFLIFKLMAHHLKLDSITVKLDVHFIKFIFTYLYAGVITIFTLGLGYPWAKIAIRKYLIENISVTTTDQSLDHFIVGKQKNLSSLGDAAGDMFDIDLDFGF